MRALLVFLSVVGASLLVHYFFTGWWTIVGAIGVIALALTGVLVISAEGDGT